MKEKKIQECNTFNDYVHVLINSNKKKHNL